MERIILAKHNPPTWAVKNKETQQSFIWSVATEQEQEIMNEIETKKEFLTENLLITKRNLEIRTAMAKSLDKSTEWLKEYINWMKMELRMTNE